MSSHDRRRGTAFTTPFRVADARWGMARVPVLPYDDPDPGAPVEPVVAEGMFLSSDIHADSSPERVARRHATVRAFQIRARRRATPQGVFAAVSELEIADTGDDLTVRTGRVRSYPNPVWLHEVCNRVLDSADVLRGLRFAVTNLAVRRGDRLEVECPSGDTLTGPQRVSIRATEAVDVIMDVCRGRASWRQVKQALAHKRPNVPDDAVDAVLRALVRNGFVLTDLAPADVCNDPLGHVIAKLPTTEPLSKHLSRLRAALTEADRHPPGHADRMTALKTARNLTDDLASTWRPLCGDSACDARIRIRRDLAEQAARAAGVLWRVAPGHDRLADWHESFLHRYGAQRLVPLLEACDPVIGLGCDVSDTHQPSQPDATEALAGLLIDALTSGEIEIRLDAATIDALDRRRPGDRPEPSAEVYARIVGPDIRNGNEGNFVVAVTRMAAPAGSTRARFTGLLPDPEFDADTGDGAMTAELAFQPLSHAATVLTGPTDGAPWRIPIGTIPRPGDLLLHDLAMVSDGRHLSLWSTRHQRRVRPVHHNQLGHHLMPKLAAFLCLVGQHGTVPLRPWTWAPFDRAPFLPRVRHHDTILAPARWRLPTSLRDATSDPTTWDNALQEWRTSTRPAPPNPIVVDDTDRQLPLHLDRHDDRELLRRYVARGVATVTEPPGGPEAVQAVASGPTGHHALEIVVPLACASDPERGAAPPPQMRVREPGQGFFLPGSQWLSLAVNAPPSTQDAVLERLAATASDTSGLWDRWFWLRYTTPERGHHLRVRFHGEPTALGGHLLPLLRHACARLTAAGLSEGFAVEPYDQEIERYGGTEAITVAETVFHRDSELVAAILAATADTDERMALTAVSAAEITRIVTDHDRAALVPYRLDRADRRIQARIRPQCRALDDATPPHHSQWEAQAAALKIYRDLLPSRRRIDCASSLIHMHANRLLGDNHQERIARSLAADLIARDTRCHPSNSKS